LSFSFLNSNLESFLDFFSLLYTIKHDILYTFQKQKKKKKIKKGF